MKLSFVLALALSALLAVARAEPPKTAPLKAGETRSATVRDASGKVIARHVTVAYPSGQSVTVRDASGKITGTYFLPTPKTR
jgi:hypothetical protein